MAAVLFNITSYSANWYQMDYPRREFFISSFLFMLNIGAWYIRMCNIQFKDLKRLVKCENNKIILLLQAQAKKVYTLK
jgi:hypothetical protein